MTLTVDCLLCADFLTGNKAILDCQENQLRLGDENVSTIPFLHAASINVEKGADGCYVAMQETVEIAS